jgi:polysaccharide pyruvyl transferase WcaK-like protein
VIVSRVFLLVGHGGFYNRGCEAIVRCTVDIIKGAVGDSTIVLASYDSDRDRVQIEQERIAIDKVIPGRPDGASRYGPTWVLQTLHRRLFCADLSVQDYLSRSFYKEADVVISVGGDNFSDDYGSPKQFFDTLKAARKYGAKTVIWGASIGPFDVPEEERVWADELRRVDLITVREDKSYEYLRHLGVTQNVCRVSDPAFLLAATPPTVTLPFFDAKGVVRVGVGMSDLAGHWKRGRGTEAYSQMFVDFCAHLCDTYEARILFVPHVIQSVEGRNDLAVCRDVACRVNRPDQCTVLPETLNACEMKYAISQCDYFIGARTHSTIASLSSRVPTISIGYSVKAWGINRDLLGHGDYVVDIASMETRTLIERFESLRRNGEEIRAVLQQNLPHVIDRARQAGRHLLRTTYRAEQWRSYRSSFHCTTRRSTLAGQWRPSSGRRGRTSR